jgi:OsmC-like protein
MTMAALPGTIDLGRFRLFYDEERQSSSESYLLQQRAVIRLDHELLKLEEQDDYTILCDDAKFKAQSGKRPSVLQYFIASVGFCMFTQLNRFALHAEIEIDQAEMDLRMSYDMSGKLLLADLPAAAQGLTYCFLIKSGAPVEKIIRVAQLTDKGCHTVNSMRKRLPVSGRFVLNDSDYEITD